LGGEEAGGGGGEVGGCGALNRRACGCRSRPPFPSLPVLWQELTCPLKAAAEKAKATRRAIDFIIVVEGWWLVLVVAVCVRGLGVGKVSQVSLYVCVCAAGYLDFVPPNPSHDRAEGRVRRVALRQRRAGLRPPKNGCNKAPRGDCVSGREKMKLANKQTTKHTQIDFTMWGASRRLRFPPGEGVGWEAVQPPRHAATDTRQSNR